MVTSILAQIALVLLVVGSFSAEARPLVLVADEWCPYTCGPSPLPGYMVELVEAVAKESEKKTTYRLMPWTRALSEARNERADIILGLTAADAEGFVLSEPVGQDISCFFRPTQQTWPYRGFEDLKGRKVGVIQSYSYGKDFDSFMQSHPQSVRAMVGLNPLLRNFRLLKTGRLDLVLENKYVTQRLLSRYTELNGIESIACLDPMPLYFGFSAKSVEGRALQVQFQTVFEKMKKDGRLETILKKYQIDKWW